MQLLDACPSAVMAGSWAIHVDDDDDVVDRIHPEADLHEATRSLLHDRSGPPAHGTMMFRRLAYEKVGGYRACFHYGQDHDLWLRLGLVGCIAYIPEELYAARLSPAGISGAWTDWQSQFGELGQLAHFARMRGESEEPFILRAEDLRQELLAHKATASSNKFPAIGHTLSDRNVLKPAWPPQGERSFLGSNPAQSAPLAKLVSFGIRIDPPSVLQDVRQWHPI